jgi:hypothetical protein
MEIQNQEVSNHCEFVLNRLQAADSVTKELEVIFNSAIRQDIYPDTFTDLANSLDEINQSYAALNDLISAQQL